MLPRQQMAIFDNLSRAITNSYKNISTRHKSAITSKKTTSRQSRSNGPRCSLQNKLQWRQNVQARKKRYGMRDCLRNGSFSQKQDIRTFNNKKGSSKILKRKFGAVRLTFCTKNNFHDYCSMFKREISFEKT